MGEPRILAEKITHQRVKLNTYGDESWLRREDTAARPASLREEEQLIEAEPQATYSDTYYR